MLGLSGVSRSGFHQGLQLECQVLHISGIYKIAAKGNRGFRLDLLGSHDKLAIEFNEEARVLVGAVRNFGFSVATPHSSEGCSSQASASCRVAKNWVRCSCPPARKMNLTTVRTKVERTTIA